jgi:signal transduction histidine kinase
MLKACSILILSTLFSASIGFSQIGGTNHLRDSLKNDLSQAKNDTTRVLIMAELANAYWTKNPDSLNKYANESVALARQIQFLRGEVTALNALAGGYQVEGDFPQSLQVLYKNSQTAESKGFVFEKAVSNTWMGIAYWLLADNVKSITWYKNAMSLFETLPKNEKVDAWINVDILGLGQTFLDWDHLDSAYYYLNKFYNATNNDVFWRPVALYHLGDCLFKRGDRKISFDYLRSSVEGATLNSDYFTTDEACAVLARFFDTIHLPDSAIYYAKKGLEAAKQIPIGAQKNSKWLAIVYEHIDARKALLYQKIYDSVNEVMYGSKKVQDLQKTLAEEQRRLQIAQLAQTEKENRIKQFGFLGGLGIMLVIALILFANNRQKKKANNLLQVQKQEIETQKDKAEDALSALSIAKGELEIRNRDLEVESALERVRSRTNAMAASAELREVIQLVFQELLHLGFNIHVAAFLVDYNPVNWNFWVAVPGNPYADKFIIPDFNHPLFNRMREANAKNIDFFSENYPQYEKNVFMQHFFDHAGHVAITEERKKFILSGSGLACSFVRGNNTMLFVFNYHGEACSAAENTILKRFGNSFEQTYTRFLDLQKAEFQGREAKIEAALERVRAKTMAMRRSEELADVATVLFQQVKALGVNQWTCGFCIWAKDDKEFIWYPGSDDGKILEPSRVPLTDHPIFRNWVESRRRGDELYIYEKKGEVQADHYRYMMTVPGLRESLQDMLNAGFTFPTFQIDHVAHFAYGNLLFITYEHFPEMHDVFKRFAKVFEQTYTRFLDLQKAEIQAKEATIEAALEKVRGKAMAMHDSQDLSSTASMVIAELRKLGINPFRCGVALKESNSRKAQIYTSSISADGSSSLALIGWTMLSNNPIFSRIYETGSKNEDYFPVLRGEEIKSYYEHLNSELSEGLSMPYIPDWAGGQVQHGYFISISVGWLYAWSLTPYNEAEVKIIKRFASVIDLTFRRYRELQQSEANAKEAVRTSSLDRVRAEIASMRNTVDLDKITPLIWNELNVLNVSFIRCGVFIMDEKQGVIHTFLSTPEGKSIAVVQVPFDTPGKLAEIITSWRRKELYSKHWIGSDFNELADTFVKEGAFASQEQYLHSLPDGGFFLNLLPFMQGMLYVGTMQELEEEEIELIQSLANAFSTAYARYEDFNHLEAAKQQIEKTLSELKATQAQLIQSEKMASLGEITAGIAHEIQNPLNFINNFAQVNEEFIEEAKEAINKGNLDEAKNLLHNLKDNQEKINQHGIRADSIVKGMLEHSRTSTGQKEPTDINALIDEYLRLSYHGWRAKDKSINIRLIKSFDPALNTLSLIPQDIGRVILNLFNNAFYAVSEKKKLLDGSFEPTVSVSTEKTADKVTISIRDNGNGIPQKIINKIFQPFFTTKPTGSGTGLGLSLAYDIVKAHGGEIGVETEEGEGTSFTIQLPN